MDGVIEMTDVDYPHSHTNQGDDLQDKQQEGHVDDISCNFQSQASNIKMFMT